ncbi:UNVERIFIED_CONTAM: hypothetical protein Sindi_3043800 [Sesamum indicum]
MEVLNLILQQLSDQDRRFVFHWRCEQLRLVQLEFADNLLLFYRAESESVRVLKQGLDLFGDLSDLRVNSQKSNFIISRPAMGNQDLLIDQLRPRGLLSMKYLGLALISSRLTISNCRPLLLKLDQRIKGWEGMSLVSILTAP